MVTQEKLNRLFWHSRRGMLELDLLLVPFVQEHYAQIDEADQKRYDDLIKEEDFKPKSKSDTQCSPHLNIEAGSCVRLVILIELVKAYNKDAPSRYKIKLHKNYRMINPLKYKLYLIDPLKKRICDKCTSQKCWSTLEFTKNMEIFGN